METHDHHSPFANDIHLSSIASVFPRPTAMIYAGPERAIWHEVRWELSSSRDPGLSHLGETLLWKPALPSRGSQPRSLG